MSYIKAKKHQILFRLGFTPDPAGELTAIPQTANLDFRGPSFKGRGEEGREGRAREGEKRWEEIYF